MATDAITEFAPAKINLCLHVTGRRADGYHLLDSLVVFAGAGDRVTAAASEALSLRVTGPEAATVPAGTDNLVLAAARVMGVPARLTLDKVLPVASGIGGGSADAAATLRALARLTGRPLPAADEVLALGADVPVCLLGRPVRMQGVGEVLLPLSPLPKVWVLLVNPRVPVPTPQVFAALTHRENPPIPALPQGWPGSAAALAEWLGQHTRNDLAAAALAIAPVLAEVQAALAATPGCLLARMSGSGATHFGLYASQAEATRAEALVRQARPDWWVAAAEMLPA